MPDDLLAWTPAETWTQGLGSEVGWGVCRMTDRCGMREGGGEGGGIAADGQCQWGGAIHVRSRLVAYTRTYPRGTAPRPGALSTGGGTNPIGCSPHAFQLRQRSDAECPRLLQYLQPCPDGRSIQTRARPGQSVDSNCSSRKKTRRSYDRPMSKRYCYVKWNHKALVVLRGRQSTSGRHTAGSHLQMTC